MISLKIMEMTYDVPLIPGPVLIESGDISRGTEGVLTFLKIDHISTVEHQVCMNSKKCGHTAIILEDKAHNENKLIHINVVEHCKNGKITEELVVPTGSAIVDLKYEGTDRPQWIQAEEEQAAVTNDTNNEVKKQRSISEVEVMSVAGEASATVPSRTSAAIKSDDQSIYSPEIILELPGSEELEEVTAESETAQKPKFEDFREEQDLLETEKVNVTFTQVQDIEDMDRIANSADKEVEKPFDVGEKTSEAYAEMSNKGKVMFSTAKELIIKPQANRNESCKMICVSDGKAATSEHTNVNEIKGGLNSTVNSEEGRRDLNQEISLLVGEIDSHQMESDSSNVSDRENRSVSSKVMKTLIINSVLNENIN